MTSVLHNYCNNNSQNYNGYASYTSTSNNNNLSDNNNYLKSGYLDKHSSIIINNKLKKIDRLTISIALLRRMRSHLAK